MRLFELEELGVVVGPAGQGLGGILAYPAACLATRSLRRRVRFLPRLGNLSHGVGVEAGEEDPAGVLCALPVESRGVHAEILPEAVHHRRERAGHRVGVRRAIRPPVAQLRAELADRLDVLLINIDEEFPVTGPRVRLGAERGPGEHLVAAAHRRREVGLDHGVEARHRRRIGLGDGALPVGPVFVRKAGQRGEKQSVLALEIEADAGGRELRLARDMGEGRLADAPPRNRYERRLDELATPRRAQAKPRNDFFHATDHMALSENQS